MMSERRLLIFLWIICPFLLHFGLSLSALSVILLWLTFTLSVLVFTTVISKNTAGVAEQNAVVTHSAKRFKRDSGNIITAVAGDNRAVADRKRGPGTGSGPFKNYVSQPVISPIISPISPHQNISQRESEYLQRSGYKTEESGWRKSKHFEPVILSKSPDHRHRSQDLYVSRGPYSPSMPSYSSTEKFSPRQVSLGNISVGRTSLSNVRSPLISPSKNHFIVNSSPQLFKPIHKMSFPLDHDNSISLPLTNRHYPTHQPQYTQTSMGLLPASSIFYGDGAGLSLSPLRKRGTDRTHSPVTVKIARPDNRRSASPLLRRLSLEQNSGSSNPLHRDAVIAALNEKRKRINTEEPDDTSSVASSAGVVAKRRRLENGSRSSTPSIADSPNYSMINGFPQSDSSPEGSTRARKAPLWSGRRGVESHTPRNAIDSSVSSSRRAAIEKAMMRKRLISQPPMPEDSPKRKCQPPDSPQGSEAGSRDVILQLTPQGGSTAAGPTNMTQSNGKPGSEMQEANEDPTSSKDATPSKVQPKDLFTPRLKTPKLGKHRPNMPKQSGSSGGYTADDLQEDRLFAKKRVNRILRPLQEEEDKDKPQNEKEVTPADQQPFSAPLGVSKTPLGSGFPTPGLEKQAPSVLGVTEIDKAKPSSAIKPPSAINPPASSTTTTDGQLFAPMAPKNDSGLKKLQAFNCTDVQEVTPADKQPFSAPLGVSKTPLGSGFPTPGLEKQAPPVLGVTETDKAKPSSAINPPASSTTTTDGQLFAPMAPKNDSGLKKLPAGTAPAATGPAKPAAGDLNPLSKTLFRTVTTPSPGFPPGSPVAKPPAPTSNPMSLFAPTFQVGPSNTQPPLQPGGASLVPQSSAPPTTGPQILTTKAPTASTFGKPSPADVTNPGGHQYKPVFGAPTQPAAPANPSGGFLFPANSAATSGSVFGTGAAPAAGTASLVPQSSAPSTSGSQLSTKAPTFGNEGVHVGGAGGPKFTPAFGAPTQPAQQPSKPLNMFDNRPAVPANQPAAASSGRLTFPPNPAANSGSVFGTGAAPAAGASPFQTGAVSTATGMFAKQSSQPPSFGSTSRPTSTFGSAAPGPGLFGSQSSTAPPNAGSFNFGAPNPSQANPSSGFAFGGAAATQQPAASQPASGGLFQFGQTNQQASQPMGSVGGFATPSRPTTFNFGAGGGGGFGTPAPSAAPTFGAVTPTNPAGFSLGSSASTPTQKRTSRLTRQNRQRSNRR